MRIAMTLLALSLAMSMTACKKKKTEDTGGGMASGSTMAGSGTDTMAGSGSSMAGSGSDMAGSGSGGGSADMAGSGSAGGSDAEQMARAAGNCPSTVGKSTTKADVKGKAIELTISSDDKDAINTIQRRTEELVAIKKGGGGSGSGSGHDARGTHKGKVGLCPIHVPEGAKIESKKNAKGVVVTITPKDGLEDLKKEIDARITKAADWVKANVKDGEQGTSGGVGGGKGDHGGNHSGSGDGKGKERKDGTGGGAGTGGGGGAGSGGGSGSGAKK